jgi:hypothetical protein
MKGSAVQCEHSVSVYGSIIKVAHRSEFSNCSQDCPQNEASC